MADQRSAEPQTPTDRTDPPARTEDSSTAATEAPSRASITDIQTSSGVPAAPIGRDAAASAGERSATSEAGPSTAATRISFAVAPGRTTARTAIAGTVAPGTRRPPTAEPLIVDPGAATRPTPPRTATRPPTADARSAGQPSPAPAAARRRWSMPDLGQAPAVLALSSFGVLLVALGYAGGRDGSSGALLAYWIGQVVVFTPVVARLLSRRLMGVSESFLLVMGLAINQYFLKWMYSPDQFRFPDELQHWLATTILLESGELFQPNPALPPAVNFPGLAEMGAALASMTGLPVTAAGLLVAGVAHLLFVAGLYAVVLRATRSAAIAGVTCVVYATSLHYLFFNSMYLYATAALPFLMLAVWATRRWRAGGGWPFAATAVVAMFGATASHHVTAFMMVATLSLLGAAEWVLGGRPRRWKALIMPAASLAVVGAWIGLVAQDVIGYLAAPVDQIGTTIAVLMGDQPADASAAPAPVSLVQLGIQALGLLVLFALYLGVGRDMLQKRDRDAWRWATLAGGGLFFAGNGVRFLGESGPEIAGRLSTFTYVPISIVAAVALVQATRLVPRRNADGRWLRGAPLPPAPPATGTRRIVRIAAGSAAITLLMVAARVGGWPPTWEMLPGPYLAAGFERSVDAYGIAATDWTRTTLGPDNRIGGDVTTVFLASTYGRQDPVREVAPLFYSERWGLADEELVEQLGLEYLVVDERLGVQRPAESSYFEFDPDAAARTNPISPARLSKFDSLLDVDRLYDNGTIRIYHMGDR